MAKFVDKIEEAQALLLGVSEDLNTILNMAKLAVPMVEQTVGQAKGRIHQIERLFSNEEEEDARE